MKKLIEGGLPIHNATKKGYIIAYHGDGCYTRNISKKRGTVQKGMVPCIKAGLDVGVVVEWKKNTI